MKLFLPVSVLVLGAVIALLLAAGCMTAPPANTGTVSPTATVVPVTTTSTPFPTPTAMFPDALALKETFVINVGDTAGEATVYRYWLNDTYRWHNTLDNKDYTQIPSKGNRYLIIFVNIVNTGNNKIWPPSTNAIHLWYAGNEYALDPDHYLPGNVRDETNRAVTIDEIQYYHQLHSADLVSDYRYSHGQKLGAIYPGESNALDGYLIYVVPASLTPDQAYVQIVFNGKDTGVWNLA